MGTFERPEWRLAVALGIGLVLGAERERRKGPDGRREPAGVRTFAIVGLIGGVAGLLGTDAIIVGLGLFVAAIAVVGYVAQHRADLGYTTEVALVLDYALGVLAQRHPTLALATGATAAMLLAFRARIHKLVRQALTTRELLDLIIFAVAAVVVLPLLPDHPVGPLDVINPATLWRLVVLVMGITGGGYALGRIVGPRYGLAVAGLASGFVSSIATIGAMGARATSDEKQLGGAVAGAALSTVATFVQLAILVGAASPALLQALALPLSFAGVAALGYGLLQMWRAATAEAPHVTRGRAFSLRGALLFALLVAGVLLVSTLIERRFGRAGVIVAAGAAGFADSHAPAASAGAMHAAGKLSIASAAFAVLATVTTNTVSKIVIAATSGPRSFALRVIVGLVIVLAAAWVGLLVARLVG